MRLWVSRLMLFAACVTALETLPSSSNADDEATPELHKSQPVIVTASRTPTSFDETLASVSLIDREAIERNQAATLTEVLRGVSGLAVSQSGGIGKTSSVFIRGTESDHVLVLVDGVEIGSTSLGIPAYQSIPAAAIDRVEVVRGPRSSLYGSDAIGGVIQIFTRKGQGGLTPWLDAGGGSHNTYSLATGLSGGSDHAWFSITGAAYDTEGIDACSSTGVGGCFANEPDEDGYSNQSVTARGGIRFSDVEADFRFLRAEGSVDFDGNFTNRSDFVQQVIGGSVRIDPFRFMTVRLTAGRNEDDSDDMINGRFSSRFDSTKDTVSLQSDISIGANHLFTAGADYQRDAIDSSVAFTTDSRNNKGVFLQHRTAFGAFTTQASLRYDRNSQFGSETTGTAAAGYALSDSFRVRASYGTAFKAPTFNELFFPGFGNPNLSPETAESVELGARGRIFGVDWDIAVYRTEIDDLIAFDSVTFTPMNIAEARIHGLEAQVSTTLAGTSIRLRGDVIDTENRTSGPDRGKRLPRRPSAMFTADVERAFGALLVGGRVRAEDRRFDDIANGVRISGFITADLHVRHRIADGLSIEARLNNVFDERYETARFFNEDGRNFFVTVRYRPGGSE